MAVALTAEAAGLSPEEHVRKVAFGAKSSFLLPMLFLEKKRREAMLAFYAFCRETDDIADEEKDPAIARAKLEAWRREIAAAYTGGQPANPIMQALAGHLQDFNVPQNLLTEILDGMAMDMEGRMVRPPLAVLEKYCYRVASCVGLVSIQFFGYRDLGVQSFAIHLGQALQLTNILRDIDEDAARGRVYLPRELLEKHGLAALSTEDLLKDPRLAALCAELGGYAEGHFEAAAEALHPSERRRMLPARMMGALYREYLRLLKAAGWRPEMRVRLAGHKKILLFLKVILGSFSFV